MVWFSSSDFWVGSDILGHGKTEEHVGQKQAYLKAKAEEKKRIVENDKNEDTKAYLWVSKKKSQELRKAHCCQYSQYHHEQERKLVKGEV